MRSFTLPLLALLFLGSCTTYQYTTVDSSQLRKNDLHQLVFENDTMAVTYDFSGQNGPLRIRILNKTDQPLYISWKKSALIRGEQSVSYFDRNIQFSGGSSSYTIGHTSTGAFGGALTLPEGVSFIPPGSSTSKVVMFMTQSGPTILSLSDSIRQKKVKNAYTHHIKYRQINYEEASSPIQFKSYLVFALGLNSTQEFAETNRFYVSQAVETKGRPGAFPLYQKPGDKFFSVLYKPDLKD